MTVFEYAGRLLIVDCGVLFPEDAPARRRPDPAGLRLHPGPAGRRRGASSSRTATRTTSARCPYLLRETPDIPLIGSRLTLALRRGQAARAPDQARTPARCRRGRPSSSARSSCEFVAVNHSIPDAPGRRDPHPGRAGAAHRRLQDGPAAAGRPDHRPARASPGSARRASTCSWSTPPTPRCPASSRTERDIEPVLDARLRQRRAAGSSWPASPRTCTGSSRSSTPRARTSRKVAFVGRSMVRNMGIARDLGYLTVPAGTVVVASTSSTHAARRRGRADLHRLAGRADGGAVPDGQQRPRRSRSARATPWCWRPR